MAWDIYGNKLAPGYCEVHPHINQEYPCSVCMRERDQNQNQSPEQLKAEIYELNKRIIILEERVNKMEQSK